MGEDISAFASVLTATIALVAAVSWLGDRKHRCADECIAAIYDICNLVGRIKWANEQTRRPDILGPAFFDAWNGCRQFQLAHIVARRYFRLDEATPSRVAGLLSALEAWSEDVREESTKGRRTGTAHPAWPIEDIERRLGIEAEAISTALRSRWDDILLFPNHWPRG